MIGGSQDVCFATISELAAGLRAKAFSTVELVRAHCDRLETIGASHRALACSLRSDALARAEEVDRDLARGRVLGPLQGIPYGVKDLLAIRNHPTTWGSPAFATQVFDEDARVVELLHDAQAIPIGKLAMLELAGAGVFGSTAASLTGPAINPWDRTRWSGGSSSGSAIATAAGLVSFALGSDTIGSILAPSLYCGITGFRPTHGLVDLRGALQLSPTLDVLGPMCRSAEDCALVLQVMSEGKAGFLAPSRDAKAGLKIGYNPLDYEQAPELRAVFVQGLDDLRSLGCELVEVAPPKVPFLASLRAIDRSETAASLEDFIRSPRLDLVIDGMQKTQLKSYLGLPAIDYVKAFRVRSQIQDYFRENFRRVDFMMTRGFTPADLIDKTFVEFTPPASRSLTLRPLTALACLAGLPVIGLPCGFIGGLPIGLLVTCAPGADDRLLELGRLFQSGTDWHRRRPPVDA